MVKRYRSYVVGPLLAAGVGMDPFLQDILERCKDSTLQNFALLKVAGPVVYRQEWGKTVYTHFVLGID